MVEVLGFWGEIFNSSRKLLKFVTTVYNDLIISKNFRAAFVFRNPTTVRSMDIFLKPLSLSIWVLTFFCAICGVILLRGAFGFERNNMRRKVETSWNFLVLYTIGTFCQQGILILLQIFFVYNIAHNHVRFRILDLPIPIIFGKHDEIPSS